MSKDKIHADSKFLERVWGPSCDHYWIVKLLPNGDPDYRVGVHGIRTPAAHATCQKCNARTYFTEEQLAEIPVRSEP